MTSHVFTYTNEIKMQMVRDTYMNSHRFRSLFSFITTLFEVNKRAN